MLDKIIKLPHSPAFGFETFKMNAYVARTELCYTRLGRIFRICMDESTADGKALFSAFVAGGVATIALAISKILGYLPVISVVVGISRIIDVVFWNIIDTAAGAQAQGGAQIFNNKKWHLIRGFMELGGLGPALLLADLYITYTRSKYSHLNEIRRYSWLIQ